jgi:hypothetical protein
MAAIIAKPTITNRHLDLPKRFSISPPTVSASEASK